MDKKILLRFEEVFLFLAVVVQIFLLLTLTVSNSYAIYQSDSFFDGVANSGGVRELVDWGLNFLVGFLSIDQVGFVSASPDNKEQLYKKLGLTHCCLKLKNGGICESADPNSQEDRDSCDGALFPKLCFNIRKCKLGICYDPSSGRCSPKYSSQCDVSVSGVEFIEDEEAHEIDKCKLGCCTVGLRKSFVTRRQCEISLGKDDAGDMFDDSVDFDGCKVLNLNDLGACISGESCKFVTRKDCDPINFKDGKLCTHRDFTSVNCHKTRSTVCSEGKVYFQDSCGNRANVYNSLRADDPSYWDELIKDETTLCSVDFLDEATVKSCGNCVATDDAVCNTASSVAPNIGNNICRSRKCVDGTGKEWRHGESWCVYEGNVGDRRDVVGSSHMKMECWNGVIRHSDPDHLRRNICTSTILTKDGQPFSRAIMRTNTWKACYRIDIPQKFEEVEGSDRPVPVDRGRIQTGVDKCEAIPDCMVHQFTLDRRFGGKNEVIDECKRNTDFVALCRANPDCFMYESHDDTHYKDLKLNELVEVSEVEQKRNDCSVESSGCRLFIDGVASGFDSSPVNCDPSSKGADVDAFLSSNSYIDFQVCVPRYPPAHLDDEHKEICDVADIKCPILETRTSYLWGFLKDGWKISQGKECLSQEFTDQANHFCRALGDCGGYVNVAGVYSENFDVKVSNTETGAKAKTSISSGFKDDYLSYVDDLLVNVPEFIKPAFDDGDVLFGGKDFSKISDEFEYVLTKEENEKGLFASIIAGFVVTVVAILGNALLVSIGVALITVSGGTLAVLFVLLAVVVAVASAVIGISTEKNEAEVTFDCHTWKPPAGGDCDKCEGELAPCNEYKCRSLGAACEPGSSVGAFGISRVTCRNPHQADSTPPSITYSRGNYDTTLETESNTNVETGVVISGNAGGEEILSGDLVEFYLMTDEPAKCKFGWDSDFDDSESESIPPSVSSTPTPGSGGWAEEHKISRRFSNVDPSYVLTTSDSSVRRKLGYVELFVKCEDRNSNPSVTPYVVTIHIIDEPDLTPPYVKSITPPKDSFLAYGKTEVDVEVFFDEPIEECKWDYSPSAYDSMVNSFTSVLVDDADPRIEVTDSNCDGSFDPDALSYSCTTKFTGLDEPQNDIYIACKDLSGNIMSAPYHYVLYPTQNELVISSASSEVVGGSSTYRSVKLKLVTSGGAYDGLSICSFEIEKPDTYKGVTDGFSTEPLVNHEYSLDLAESGDYDINLICREEDTGNEANGNIEFNLDVSPIVPKLTRVFAENGNLKIELNDENAECFYSENTQYSNCGFGFKDDGTLADTDNVKKASASGKIHTIPATLGNYYNVKCVDEWGNGRDESEGCVIQISLSELV